MRRPVASLRSAILRRMSAVERLHAPGPDVQAQPAAASRPAGLPILCPYLATVDGTWRSATAVRDHRCLAVSPAVPLAAEKQRRLCLVDRHVDCATYGAAIVGHAPTGHAGHSRPLARMAPVILDHGRFDLRLPALRADRPTGQAALVAVLAIAFVAILLARPAGDPGAVVAPGSNGAAPGGASSGAATDSAVASASPVPASEAPEETDRPVTSEPPASPSATPASAAPSSAASLEPATSGETYRVKSGDTLSAIAARFGTTTGVLVRLNGLTDPSKLKVGQVLKLP